MPETKTVLYGAMETKVLNALVVPTCSVVKSCEYLFWTVGEKSFNRGFPQLWGSDFASSVSGKCGKLS